MTLSAKYDHEQEPVAFIEGQYLSYSEKKQSNSTSFLGISLEPWATTALFNIPAIEFTGQIVDLELVSRPIYDKLIELIGRNDMDEHVVHALNRMFTNIFMTPKSDKDQLIIEYSKKLSSRPCQSNTLNGDPWPHSYRLMQMKFKDLIGMTIKQYSGKHQFQNAVRMINTMEDISLTHIALQCGYYDQAHFINSFKKYTGIQPNEYRKALMNKTESLNSLTQVLT